MSISIFANSLSIIGVNGNNLVISGNSLKKGDRFLVFSKNGSFKGEVSISSTKKHRIIAKQVLYSVKDYKAPRFSTDDILTPFYNYSYSSVISQPSAYLGEYFCWKGDLIEARPFGDSEWYLKFRFIGTSHYIKEKNIMPYANFYAKKSEYQNKPFVVRVVKNKINDIEYKKGNRYIVYGKMEICSGYPTLTALQIYSKEN